MRPTPARSCAPRVSPGRTSSARPRPLAPRDKGNERAAQGGHGWSSLVVVPRPPTSAALKPAWSAGFALVTDRRLLSLSSTHAVRPLGRLGRLLTHPPDLQRLLAHLL